MGETIIGTDGSDELFGTPGEDTILSLAGVDFIRGGGGEDEIRGGGKEDYLRGGTGDDVIRGGSDDDFFVDGAGNDTYVGGSEIDTLRYDSPSNDDAAEAFQARVQEGDLALTANDAIKCRLREEQSITGEGLAKAVFVEEVLEFRPGPRQMDLI